MFVLMPEQAEVLEFLGAFISNLTVALVAVAGTATVGFLVWSRQQKQIREEQRLKATKALLTEIGVLNYAIRKRHYWWTVFVRKEDKWLPPLVPFATDIYDQYADRIGDLDEDVAKHIVIFHGFVKFINDLEDSRTEYLEHGQGDVFYGLYHGVLDDQIKERGDEYFEQWADQMGDPDPNIQPDESPPFPKGKEDLPEWPYAPKCKLHGAPCGQQK